MIIGTLTIDNEIETTGEMVIMEIGDRPRVEPNGPQNNNNPLHIQTRRTQEK